MFDIDHHRGKEESYYSDSKPGPYGLSFTPESRASASVRDPEAERSNGPGPVEEETTVPAAAAEELVSSPEPSKEWDVVITLGEPLLLRGGFAVRNFRCAAPSVGVLAGDPGGVPSTASATSKGSESETERRLILSGQSTAI